jgi:hypothetical protein
LQPLQFLVAAHAEWSARTAARYLRGGRLENCVNKAYLATPR